MSNFFLEPRHSPWPFLAQTGNPFLHDVGPLGAALPDPPGPPGVEEHRSAADADLKLAQPSW